MPHLSSRLAKLFLQPVCVYLCLCASAFAHSPYYTQQLELSGPDGEKLFLKILNGDGVVVADPQQVIIVNKKGRLRAATPTSVALFLICASDKRIESCVVYDTHNGLLYQPLPPRFETGAVVEKDGKPINYPDYETTFFGFSVREATPWEIAKYEFLSICSEPVVTFFTILWWALLFRISLPFVSDLRGYFSGTTSALEFVSKTVIRVLSVAVMLFLTMLLWVVSLFSTWFVAFCLGSGFLLAILSYLQPCLRIPSVLR
ncbi:hypothetical protein [Roseibium sp. Sym1]|uniref:hypothetical protein n=1 Tax=Roseibium sp. Sym1 TaxID=3016006 RepID=UPI0022B4D310|nr:hypothetical protein [Roseibium sp. Sym1]